MAIREYVYTDIEESRHGILTVGLGPVSDCESAVSSYQLAIVSNYCSFGKR